ncbi:Uncharacterised protein [Brevundimonas diminuta]|jgi:hypothetical protein|uniref:hypothetical protein n=1 Tax=Brevundimonas diminuta TaxID=293 RepID=UPI000D977670|nr:hypothetical protein [Brevundimonas diminuta]SPU43569.1 Uncharacterised protein [Brevundimonas diminuta]
MTAIAYPYLRIDPARVIAPPWAWLDDPAQQPVPDRVEHWDHTTDLRLRRQVRLDFAAVAASLGHDPAVLQLELVLTVGTGSPRGDRRRHVWKRTVLTEQSPSSTLDIELTGTELSQAVTLRTEILMLSPESSASVLSPRQRGQKLWGELRTITLEPAEPRFPMMTVSFASEFRDTPRAPWRLAWFPGDLTRDFSDSVQLFLNSDRTDFLDRVSVADAPVVSEMMHQVISQILRDVLADDTFDPALAEEAPTSVAATVLEWLARGFPGQEIAGVRQLLRTNPADFEARIGQLVAEGEDA